MQSVETTEVHRDLLLTHTQEAIDQIGVQENPRKLVRALSEDLQSLAEDIIQIGDSQVDLLDIEGGDLESRLIHFNWADQAKRFLLLWRDIQLEVQKALLFVQEKKYQAVDLQQLLQQSREVLANARSEWSESFQQLSNRLHTDTKAAAQQMDRWKLQLNPWPIYKKQIQEIAKQSAELTREFEVLQKTSDQLAQLRKMMKQTMRACKSEMDEDISQAEAIIALINEQTAGEEKRPGVIAVQLADYTADGSPLHNLHQLTTAINTQIANLSEKRTVSITSDGGLLRVKEINFRRNTDQWVSSEALPLLYEMWELSEQVDNGLNMAVVNVRNRALLLANEIKAGHEVEYDQDRLSQPFRTFLANATEKGKMLERLSKDLTQRLAQKMQLHTVYGPIPGFLSLPLQTGISEFTRRQGKWLSRVQNWLATHIAGFEQFRTQVAREERLSISERVVRTIRHRTIHPDNVAYTNILMTKGYIGESFLVGRDAEIEHMKHLIDNWKAGYRGAVLLTGQRFAGKTLFGELIANRFFANNVIRVQPNATLQVQGRRLSTTADLGEALSFVEKYTLQTQSLIWLDDLEVWRDAKVSLAENVRALSEHIDDFSGKIFYMVSCGNSLYAHLNSYFNLEKIFQTEINLDHFALSHMKEAILIRHGATHKTLVNEDGEPLSQSAFDAIVRKLHKAAEGNVGETLNKWAYYTQKFSEEKVIYRNEQNYALPYFLTPETAIILATLIFEKRTNEYRLRKLFGPAFQTRYQSILQRLISVGLLIRHPDGWLELNDAIVNDVGRMLEKDNYLKFSN